MSKSARKLLTETTVVRVSNVHQVTENMAVISYVDDNHEHVDDLYNVPNPDVMATLLTALAGKAVDATLEPDNSSDLDGHPACIAASVVEA